LEVGFVSFGDTLKELRMGRNLTQDQLAAGLGIAVKTVRNYEADRHVPKMPMLGRISEYFSVSVDDLVNAQDIFVDEARIQGGIKGAREARELVREVTGMFAGGRLSEEDMDAAAEAIMEAYWAAKKENKKFTPKQFLKA
jgi:transcriptional regulator with XRE-family HTH domain